MSRPKPEILVDPAWLAARLADPKVRVFDCTLSRVPQASGASLWESGRRGWEESHIPGAAYLHMIDDLSDPKGSIPYGLPGPGRIADLMSSLGVESEATLVLYGAGLQWVVHRTWWVLTASGARDVRVLDGGWQRWREEGRPVESMNPVISPGVFSGTPRPQLVILRDEVASALDDPGTPFVHALTAEQFAGTGGQVYGRPGRIPGSVNIPAEAIINKDTNRFRSIPELQQIFSTADLDGATTIVPYCGGGIAASTIFLGLTIAGYDNVRLYDGSLLDWTADPDAPMVTDADIAAR